MMLWMAVAWSAPDCAPFSEGELRNIATDAVSAVERGNISRVKRALADADRRLPCLDHAPSQAMLADLLMVRAVLAYAEGEDWTSPLASALRIDPEMDRFVGPASPLYSWTPPPEGPKVSLGEHRHSVYLDGVQVETLPLDAGWYVVQRQAGRDWDTDVMEGTALNAQWATDSVSRPRAFRYDVRFAGGIGGRALAQRFRWTDASTAPDVEGLEPSFDFADGGAGYKWRNPGFSTGAFVHADVYPIPWFGLRGGATIFLAPKTRLLAEGHVLFRIGNEMASVGGGLQVSPGLAARLDRVVELDSNGMELITTEEVVRQADLTFAVVDGSIVFGPNRAFDATARVGYRIGGGLLFDSNFNYSRSVPSSEALFVILGLYNRVQLSSFQYGLVRVAEVDTFNVHTGVRIGVAAKGRLR